MLGVADAEPQGMFSNRSGAFAAVAAFSLTLAGPAGLAAQSAAAAPAPAGNTTTPEGLLDPIIPILTGLTDTLKGLLDSAGLSQLTSLTSALSGGTPASSDALAPLTALLNSLDLADLAALTGSSSDGQLASPFLEPLSDVLAELSALDGLTGAQADALSGLQAALAGVISGAAPTDAVAGLPLAGLLELGDVTALTDLLATLQGGQASSPELLAPVSALLTTVAGTSGLPAPVAEAIATVAGQLAGATSLDRDLLTQVGQLLNSIAATPGVPEQVGDVLATLSGLLGSPGTTTPPPTTTTPTTTTPTTTTPTTTTPAKPAPSVGTLAPGSTSTATAAAAAAAAAAAKAAAAAAGKVPAKLKTLRFDRKRSSLVLTLSCPTGKGACGSILFAVAGSRSVVKPLLLTLRDGQVVERRLKLDAKSRRTLKRKALKVVVYAATSKTQVATRSLKIKKAPKAKRARKAARRG